MKYYINVHMTIFAGLTAVVVLAYVFDVKDVRKSVNTTVQNIFL